MSANRKPKLFKYRHYQAEIILLCLRWYLRYSRSYRDLEEMMAERGLCVDHTTINCWAQSYAPVLEKRRRAKLSPTNGSWRVDDGVRIISHSMEDIARVRSDASTNSADPQAR